MKLNFSKKKAELIPLEELQAALRLCRMLREKDHEKYSNGYANHVYMSMIFINENYSTDLIEDEIIKHGYKKLDDKFYKEEDLKRITTDNINDFTKDGDTLFPKETLALLTPLSI